MLYRAEYINFVHIADELPKPWSYLFDDIVNCKRTLLAQDHYL